MNGLVAKDKFHVSYRGAALNSSLSQTDNSTNSKSIYPSYLTNKKSDLVSYTRETSSSSKQKGKRAHIDHGEAHDCSNHDAKKHKKVVETESACQVISSPDRQRGKYVRSVARLTKDWCLQPSLPLPLPCAVHQSTVTYGLLSGE
ncbi:Uncharacterized protein Fot_49710 [Forsythia ovata]|uniref:Uncharacterized protein n=1 Tax=Forsythia ovata TaxID=205694 RepID=A0ABD1QCM6_9LAMI